jgi:hypothetical protein
MVIVQERFSKEAPFKGEGRKRYKKLVLGLVGKGRKGRWARRRRGVTYKWE